MTKCDKCDGANKPKDPADAACAAFICAGFLVIFTIMSACACHDSYTRHDPGNAAFFAVATTLMVTLTCSIAAGVMHSYTKLENEQLATEAEKNKDK